MRIILRNIAFVAVALTISGNALADSSFSICGWVKSKCQFDSTAKWTDTLSKVDYATESVKSIRYNGIAIESEGGFRNLTIYLKGYKGVGKYTLEGTESTHWSRKTNAVYSDDLAHAPIWVSTKHPGGSYVEITEDKNGLLSGNYNITVYLDGDATNQPVRLNGQFKNVPKSKI